MGCQQLNSRMAEQKREFRIEQVLQGLPSHGKPRALTALSVSIPVRRPREVQHLPQSHTASRGRTWPGAQVSAVISGPSDSSEWVVLLLARLPDWMSRPAVRVAQKESLVGSVRCRGEEEKTVPADSHFEMSCYSRHIRALPPPSATPPPLAILRTGCRQLVGVRAVRPGGRQPGPGF